MSPKLSLDASPASLAASLVSLVVGYTPATLTVTSNAAKLDFDGVSGSVAEVLTAIVTKHHGHAALLGASDAEKAQVADWFGILSSTLAAGPVNRAFLDRLNAHLLASSFLAASSFRPTIVDYAVWAAVQGHLAAAEVSSSLPNLSRWSRYIAASIPRTPATTAWVTVPLASTELPAALQSKIAEMDLTAAAAADAKLRATPAAAAAAGGKPPAGAAAAPAKDAKKTDAAPAAAASSSSSAAKPAAGAAPAADAKKSDKKAEKASKGPKAAAAPVAEVPQVYRVDFRIGKILTATAHPTEAKLLVLTVDAGEASGPRTVVSGLAEYYKSDELVGRLVVMIANLKAGDLKGVVSAGRLMVATSADGTKKELAQPPAGAKVGEQVTFASVPKDKAPDAELAAKRFHEILKGLKTNGEKRVQYVDTDFMTSAGPVTVPTVADGTVA